MRGPGAQARFAFRSAQQFRFPEEAEVGVELHQLKRFHDAVLASLDAG
jgi:hypothetical protein